MKGMRNLKKRKKDINLELSATSIAGQPETTEEMVNKYGTYEIQPTNDSDNKFPTISTDLTRKRNNK